MKTPLAAPSYAGVQDSWIRGDIAGRPAGSMPALTREDIAMPHPTPQPTPMVSQARSISVDGGTSDPRKPLPRSPAALPLGDQSWTAVKRYLEENIGSAVCLREMAQLACASRFHCARGFRARTGKSPMAYVMEERIRRAKLALSRTDSKVSAIAQDLGFYDQSHFCRTFSRHVGASPRQYRAISIGHPLKE